MRFVDTNVLLYAISRDPAEQDKAKHANDILAERDLAAADEWVLNEKGLPNGPGSTPSRTGSRNPGRTWARSSPRKR